ncbi:ATP-grasp fold amidoligase family protein [Globicatella sulfidifaciens]|uniref:Glycosyltransferase n=1 Tax=Globicatella sulfidifaciens TaxID=136093 RepID=A0A7X8GZX8_9LACT|nr:ATP-grasp fold amidoligase family protein [Globicatella sulfidifaciens]NLJ18279.1 glycosyltransferase [Globicatella sulfidifaciens]
MNNQLKNIILAPMNLLYQLSPKLTLNILYRLKMKQKLNLKKPINYNEKLQWIKLYEKNDLMPICADKYTVRQYVQNKGCGEILNELIWEGYNPDEIPFSTLPEKFVIKVTHGAGFNIICKNKADLDKKKVIKQLKKWLKTKYIRSYGEWFYGVIKPRIIIEKFLSEDGETVPVDYKMFYFNNYKGRKDVAFTVIDTDRFSQHKRKIYDDEWNLMKDAFITFPYDEKRDFEKPKHYDKMVKYAQILGEPFKHARVDFYVINSQIYFGEITFTNGAGFAKIAPEKLNEEMGSWIKL